MAIGNYTLSEEDLDERKECVLFHDAATEGSGVHYLLGEVVETMWSIEVD